jgi:phospholipid transport system substrate-binding protein
VVFQRLMRCRAGAPITRRRAGALLCAAALLAAAGALPGPARAATAPAALVQDFNATLLQAMKNAQSLGYAGRRDLLSPKLIGIFHLPVMARIAVGSHWRALDAQQQAQLVDSFTRMTVATYANRFDGWSGESFEMRGEEPVREKTVLVKTALLRPKDEPVEINYLMREFSDGWRVIDVYLKQAYSELATRRSEYSSIISREGFDALIRDMEAKIAEYAQKAQ